MRHMTATGVIMGKAVYVIRKLDNACARGAVAAKSGKIIPPGNFPAQANAIDKSLTKPTLRGASVLVKGSDGSTMALVVNILDRPW